MNKRIKLIISFLMVTFFIFNFNVNVFAFTGAGAGTEVNPYIITNPEQLAEMRTDVSSHFKLGNDIDMVGVMHVPIGNTSLTFKGSLDGAGYKIKNLKIEGTSYVGLFGYTQGAELKNIIIEDAEVTGGSYVGIIVGCMYTGKMVNCNTTGYLKADSYAGGLAGGLSGGIIEKSYSTATLGAKASDTYNFGGLVGLQGNIASVIKESYFAGNINKKNSASIIGGILGSAKHTITIENCFAVGLIEVGPSTQTGGIIGTTDNGYYAYIKNSYFGGKISYEKNPTSYYKYVFGLSSTANTRLSVTNSYFDGMKTMVDDTKYAKITAGMVSAGSYTGWDFSTIWAIDEGASYPYLKALKKPINVTEGVVEEGAITGKGTESSPYILTKPEHFKSMNYDLSGHFKLGNDIDMAGVVHIPIGNSAVDGFAGKLDGAGRSIDNLKVSDVNYAGLFRYTSGAEISNLTIKNADITGGYYNAILVADMTGGKIANCGVSGVIKTSGSSGGLVGRLGGGIIEKSYSTADIIATIDSSSNLGGLVGHHHTYATTIKESYFAGNIKMKTMISCAGGLIGKSDKQLTIENCFSVGIIESGKGETAGLIGGSSAESTKIINSYFSGELVHIQPLNNQYNDRFGLANTRNTNLVVTNSYFDGMKANYKNALYSKLASGMVTSKGYKDWDFTNIWAIDEGSSLPYLKNMPKPEKVTEVVIDESLPVGGGTVDNPYIITKPEHLNLIAYGLGEAYSLGKDINMEGIISEPIGGGVMSNYESYAFSGSLDGCGNKIENLKIEGTDHTGLFGQAMGANIENLTIKNADVTGGNNVGILVGTMNGGTITNCGTSGEVRGSFNIGGIIGSAGAVMVTVEKSYSTANIGSTSDSAYTAGGLIGYGTSMVLVKESYYTGNITAKVNIGYAGGIIGYATQHLAITDSFASGTYNAGSSGIAGGLAGVVGSSYNVGISNTYFSGALSAGRGMYGIAPENSTKTTITNSYFDKTKNNIYASYAVGLTSEQLTQKASFKGFDFTNIWAIEEGSSQPYLINTEVPSNDSLNVSGLKVETKGSTFFKLSWELVSSADNYEIKLDEKSSKISKNTIEYLDLLPNKEYTFKVRAKKGIENGEWAEIKIKTDEAFLGTPINIVMESSTTSSIKIQWDAVDEAEGYEVSYLDQVIDITETKAEIKELLPQTNYTITVKAKNKYTTSLPSEEKTFKTLPIQISTKFKIDSKTYKEIALSWEKLDGALSYEILRGTEIIAVEKTNVTFKDLESDKEYRFKIRGVNSGVEGGWSEEIAIKTDIALIDTPTNIGITSKLSTEISLKWDKVLEATEYEISFNGKTLKTNNNLITIEDLKPETEYTFTIKAKNNYAESETASTTVTTLKLPKILNLASTDKGQLYVDLSWDGYEWAEKYTIAYADETVESTNGSMKISGLYPNTEYRFKVRGEMGTYEGSWSEELIIKTDKAVLLKPNNILTDEIKTTATVVTWDEVKDATSYKVIYNGIEKEVSTNKITLEDLTPYTEYIVKVQAINQYTVSEVSAGITFKTLPLPLNNLEGLTCTLKSFNSVSLSWDAVLDATKYEITYNGITLTTDKTSITINDLTPKIEYTFKVKGKNSYTESSNSTVKVTTDEAILNTPTEVKVEDKTTTTVKLSWGAVDGATSYEIKYGDKKLTSETNSIIVGSLQMDTEYTFVIFAKNKYIVSGGSSPIVVKTYPMPLATVSNLKAKDRADTSVSLTWDAVQGTTSYEVKYGDIVINTTSNNITLTNLEPKTTYGFTVRATTENNVGGWSNSLKVTTLMGGSSTYNETKINTEKGLTYDIAFAADNISDFNGKVFVVKYDPEILELVDFASQTTAIDKTVGQVAGTEIEILSINNGVIEFKINKVVPEGKAWNGVLSIVKFKSLKTRSTSVYFEQ